MKRVVQEVACVIEIGIPRDLVLRFQEDLQFWSRTANKMNEIKALGECEVLFWNGIKREPSGLSGRSGKSGLTKNFGIHNYPVIQSEAWRKQEVKWNEGRKRNGGKEPGEYGADGQRQM